MRDSTRKNTKGSDSLFMISCALCTLYIIMRALSAGAAASSPQTYIFGALSLASMLSAVLSRLLCNGLILPPPKIIAAIVLAVVFVLFSVLNATLFNYGYSAKSMGFVWISDILIFIAVLLTARERNVFRLYASTIASSVVVVGVYSLYQKIYALDYLQAIASDSAAFKNSIRSKGMIVAQAFIDRLEDGWVGGGFGSDTALCAFSLLVTFFFFGIKKKNQDGIVFDIALIMGIMGIVISGSCYGVLLGKIFEVVVLFKVARTNESWIKRVLLVLGGVGMLSFMGAVLAIGLWLVTGSVIAEVVFVMLWYVEIEVLRVRYGFERYKNAEYLIGIGFLVTLCLVVAMVILAPNTSELGYLKGYIYYRVYECSFTMSAAWQAFLDAPIFGWGLDNFTEVHSIYKSPFGSSLGRAGNLYLEILADGGVALFCAFVTLLGVLLFSGSAERREHREVDFDAARFESAGAYLIIAGFVVSYAFVLIGLSEHMGLEYFIRELTSSPESFYARGVSIIPLVVHFIVNLVFLPVLGFFAFKRLWIMSSGIDYEGVVFYIRLSLIALLLYSVSGDYLFHPALSGFFWVMIGLLLARQRSWGMLSFRSRARNALAYIMLLIGIIWGTWVVWEGLVAATAESVAMANAGRYKSIEQIERAITAFDRAILLSDSNAELHIERANLLLQLYSLSDGGVDKDIIDGVIVGINKAIKARPNSSEYRGALARVLAMYYPIERKNEIVALYGAAQNLYPHNAKYPYTFAKYLSDNGDYEAAEVQAKKAIEIDSKCDFDHSTKLKSYELYKARGIVNNVSND